MLTSNISAKGFFLPGFGDAVPERSPSAVSVPGAIPALQAISEQACTLDPAIHNDSSYLRRRSASGPEADPQLATCLWETRGFGLQRRGVIGSYGSVGLNAGEGLRKKRTTANQSMIANAACQNRLGATTT
jgi:hypothetical protein